MDTSLSDEHIAAQVQQGDSEKFGALIERYQGKMARYAKRFLAYEEDREDAVQDVFLRAYEKLQSYRASEPFSPWLYRVAHNVFVNIIRKRGREKVAFVNLDTFFPAGVPDDNADEKMELPLLEPHVARLDPKYREVVVLFYFEDKNYEEIAAILEIPKATVGVRLARARKVLHTYLKAAEISH